MAMTLVLNRWVTVMTEILLGPGEMQWGSIPNVVLLLSLPARISDIVLGRLDILHFLQ